MKRLMAAATVAFVLSIGAGRAVAVPDEYDDTQSHPLRVAAYLLYPIGFTAEWLIFRPLHYVVSRPYLENIFGHTTHSDTRVY